jgi:hypothetical protein
MSASEVAAAVERIRTDPDFVAAVLREPEATLTAAFELEQNEWRALHYGLCQDVSRAIDFKRLKLLGLAEIDAAFGGAAGKAAKPGKKMTPTVIPGKKMTPTVIPAKTMTPTVIPAKKVSPTVTKPKDTQTAANKTAGKGKTPKK